MVVDPIATAQKGTCPCLQAGLTSGGQCAQYDPDCVIYSPAACNVVQFANTSTAPPSVFQVPVGDIYFTETGLHLYCSPAGEALPPNNVTFLSMTAPYFGDSTYLRSQSWSSNVIFYFGQITLLPNSTEGGCTCNVTDSLPPDTSAEDAAAYPCEYGSIVVLLAHSLPYPSDT
jgi:hypothetical protein